MKVLIAGAGQVGQSIGRELIANGHKLTLIERDGAAIKQEQVLGAKWIHGDACEMSTLEEAELEKFDVAIAATGDDKANLVHSLLAKTEFGVPRTVARVNHPGNEWLFTDQWGVDSAVSTPRLMSALVEEAVEAGNLVRILTFKESDTHLSEVTISADSGLAGQAIGELDVPDDVAPVALVRKDRPQAPRIDERLMVGDKLFFLTPDGSEADLGELFRMDEDEDQTGSTENAGL